MVVLVINSPDDSIVIDRNRKLFEEEIDISVVLVFSAFAQQDQNAASILHIVLHILELGGVEGLTGVSDDEQVEFSESVSRDLLLVDRALPSNTPTLYFYFSFAINFL